MASLLPSNDLITLHFDSSNADRADQAWLDAINAERHKEQSGPISYEVFEILVDKLEKEWFELVRIAPFVSSCLTPRASGYLNQPRTCLSRIPSVQCAMTGKERTRMPSSSVTAAT